jgi:hypothetical protein
MFRENVSPLPRSIKSPITYSLIGADLSSELQPAGSGGPLASDLSSRGIVVLTFDLGKDYTVARYVSMN